ncbi:MAG: c-type cytochrome [Verrucomicrobia bacterium]|nr:c-type cytochrome [Verrucomicrobiota bacterium]MDE3099694.1 c-type cytochrome [Verrucomicrobiota bacterium]
MKIKTRTLLRTGAVAGAMAGALCWTAWAGPADGLWNSNCASCHGKDGKGNTLMGHKLHIKDLTDAKVQAALTDEQATKDIKDGIKENGRPVMKAFGGKFNDDQVKALVAKVRSLKSGK